MDIIDTLELIGEDIKIELNVEDKILRYIKRKIKELKKLQRENKNIELSIKRDKKELHEKWKEIAPFIKKAENFKYESIIDALKRANAINDAYEVVKSNELVNKCDKCNDDRKIEFVSKYGDIIYEKCDCNYDIKYTINKIKVLEIEINNNIEFLLIYSGTNTEMRKIYRQIKYDNYQPFDNHEKERYYKYFNDEIKTATVELSKISIKDKFYVKDIKEVGIPIYTTEKEAQKYANYLNRLAIKNRK